MFLRKKGKVKIKNLDIMRNGREVLFHISLLVGATFSTFRVKFGHSDVGRAMACKEELWVPLVSTFLRFHLRDLVSVSSVKKDISKAQSLLDADEEEKQPRVFAGLSRGLPGYIFEQQGHDYRWYSFR